MDGVERIFIGEWVVIVGVSAFLYTEYEWVMRSGEGVIKGLYTGYTAMNSRVVL